MPKYSVGELIVISLVFVLLAAIVGGVIYSRMIELSGWSKSRTRKINAEYRFYQRLTLKYIVTHSEKSAVRRWQRIWMAYMIFTLIYFAGLIAGQFFASVYGVLRYVGYIWAIISGYVLLSNALNARRKR